jgi:hypothetical protein
MCPTHPQSENPAMLHVVHEHDFDKSYEVNDVTYQVGDCIVIASSDTRILSQKTVDFGTHAITPGTTLVTLTAMFHSAFAADMHDYQWGGRVPFQIEAEPGSTVEVRVRMHEVWNKDPRRRMKLDVDVNGKMMLKDYP